MVQGVDPLRRPWQSIVVAAGAVALFAAVTLQLNRLPRSLAPDQLDVAIAPPVQVMLAGGDRYLAANMNTVRLIVLNVLELDKRDYPILAKVHKDVAFLHPCQEDNYYIGQAFLPWIGELDAADEVLTAAMRCRSWDVTPGYFLAFNAFYFHKDYTRAGQLFAEIAPRGDDGQRDHLLYMASKFYEKGEDLEFAAAVIRNLEKSAVNKQLKLFLEARARRVEVLASLRNAAAAYSRQAGRPVRDLQELVSAGFLDRIPDDPLGKGYDIGGNGVIQLRN